MAYQYDAMGNVIGEYESEEERLAREKAEREAAQAQVQKQEVITRADGTQTVKTTQEVPAPPSQAQQAAQTGGPVNPADVFNRMVQAESGGQQFNRQGGILTSPAGAQGIAQIMPATAANPGFGVKPATPEEIATPEGNRAFGERYYQGLLQYFNGDVAKATAAYNAGPGAVQKNVQANQGQMNTAQLPRETQNYLGKVLGGAVNAMIPSAQASTLTDAQRAAPATVTPGAQPFQGQTNEFGGMEEPRLVPTAPTAMPAPQPAPTTPSGGIDYSLAASAPRTFGLRPTSFTPTPTVSNTTQYIDGYQAVQDDVNGLFQFRASLPEDQDWLRKRTAKRIVELSKQEDARAEAETRLQDLTARVAAGDPKASREMAQELKSEGSWVKMLMLGFISPQLAGEEAMKLGFGNKDRAVTDSEGNTGMITFRADGKPVSGIKANGTPMSQRELVVYAGGGQRQLDIVGGTYVRDSDGKVGRVVSDKKSGKSYIQTDTGREPMAGFRPQGQAGTLDMQRVQQIQKQNIDLAGDWAKLQIKVQGAAPEAANKFLGEFNAKHGTRFGLQSVSGSAPQIDLTTGQMIAAPAPQAAPVTATAPQTAVAPAPTATAPAPTATAAPGTVSAPAVPGATPAAVEATAEAAKTKAKEEAQEVGIDLGKLRAGQVKAEESADYLVTKIDQLITHPGFKMSVGVADIGERKLGVGVPIPFGGTIAGLIPGTDVSDWNARFKEVQGRQFLQAVESMKGSGALSDTEGKAATQAIARMDKSQSEKEFRDAVDDFRGIIQRGVDNTRKKLGQDAKYGTAPESSGRASVPAGAPELSPADKARAELEKRKKKPGQ